MPKTPSSKKERMANNEQYGSKFIIATLYLENILMKGKLRKAEKQISLERIRDSSNICVSNLRYHEMSKEVIFKSQRCIELELELSRLKNKMEKMKKYGMNKGKRGSVDVFEDKENDILNSNRDRKMQETRRRGRRSTSRSRSGKKRREDSGFVGKKKVKKGNGLDRGVKFNVRKFKNKYKEVEKVAVSFLQIFDNSRQKLISNLEGLQALQRKNPDSVKNNMVLKSQKLLLLSISINKWRLSSGFPTLNNQQLRTEESLLPLLNNPIGEKLWDMACLREKVSSEYQMFRLNKGYILYERSLLDFKKEIFFKRRFKLLMNSILRETQRRLKLQKVVAFYKLVASSVFIDKDELGIVGGFQNQSRINSSITGITKLKERVISSGGMDRDDSFLVGKSFFLFNRDNNEDENFPMNLLGSEEKEEARKKWIQNVDNPLIVPNDVELLELQMKALGGTTERESRLFVDDKLRKKNKKARSVLKTKGKLLRQERKNRLIKKIIYRFIIRLVQKRRSSIFHWYRQSMRCQIADLLEEFENMNIILSERAFREKVFRTKIRLLQNQISKQIEYFGKMMQEEGKMNQRSREAITPSRKSYLRSDTSR